MGEICSGSKSQCDHNFDARVLMQGLEWFVKMYVQGGCTDYRFTYDAYAPAPSQILSALAADSLQEARPEHQTLRQHDETSDAPSTEPLPAGKKVRPDHGHPPTLHARQLLGLLALAQCS